MTSGVGEYLFVAARKDSASTRLLPKTQLQLAPLPPPCRRRPTPPSSVSFFSFLNGTYAVPGPRLTSVTDGWFREISDQWKGMAMTLKVKKVLHTEKSKFQDVLVFESEKHGTILVLDGAIQCCEIDEFSYDTLFSGLHQSFLHSR